MKSLMINKVYSSAIIYLSLILLSACSSPTVLENGQSIVEWDFDHNVQFKKTKFDNKHFQIEVISHNKGNFERLSAFLLRKSYRICGGYGYKLTMIKGVESFDHYRSSPNLIMPNLTAKLECAIEK